MSRVFLTLLVGVEQHGFARARAADHAQYLAAADLEIEIIVDDLGPERRAQPPDAAWRGVGDGAANRSRTMQRTAKIASHKMIQKFDSSKERRVGKEGESKVRTRWGA